MAKKILIAFICLNLLVIIVALSFAYKTYKSIVVKPNSTQAGYLKGAPPTPTPDPNRPYSILLLGYGGGLHEGGKLTDSMMVVRVEPKLEKITLISIPRDLWVPLPVSVDADKYSKINAAYVIGSDDKKYPNKKPEFTGEAGGGQMAKYIVSKVLGFDVDYFVAVDFQAFTKVIDSLGGVEVNVQKTFDDYMYPIEKDTLDSNGKLVIDNCGKSDDEIKALTATMSGIKLEEQFPCRYEQLHFNKGLQLMSGVTALKYARSRHSPTDGGDFNRAARQRILIEAVKDKVISINFIPKIIPTIQTLASHVQTDIDFSKMEEFVGKATQLNSYKITSIALTDQNVLTNSKSDDGQAILSPLAGIDSWDEIHQFIINPVATGAGKLETTPTPKQQVIRK